MEETISTLKIVFMGVSALIGLAIPIALYAYDREKLKANHLPFWIGCIVFVLFALVLEQLAYVLLMKLPFWTSITNDIWIYGFVGGLMAGVFEETGRFVAFKTVLRKKRGNDANALMYGAGHGGAEAVILLSATMVANIVYSLQYNAGVVAAGSLSAAQSLLNTSTWMFLVGAVERIGAVAIHVSLSVLVWFAAKGGGRRFWLYPLAILLHMLVDAVAVILSGVGANVWIIEGLMYAMAAAFAVLAYVVWKRNHQVQEPALPEELPAEAQA